MRFGAMGDMILLVPMLKALHQRYGQPCELVASGPWTIPLMQRVPACGRVHLLSSRRAPYWLNPSQWRLVAHLRRRPPGPVYIFESDHKPHEWLRRAGIGPEWVCSLQDCPRLPGEHIVTHALRLARLTPRALASEAPPAVRPAPDTTLALRDEDRRDCTEWMNRRGLTGAPLVLIQPGNKKTMKGGNPRRRSNVKYWPEANWAAVIDGVRRQLPSARVVICGAPSESGLARAISTRLTGGSDRVVLATDDLPIPRLLALQERAHSLIGVDTGPAHSAAAMGCPEVVLFARHALTAASLYAPVSTAAPVRILQPAPEAVDAGLTTITPDGVLAAWRELDPLATA